MSYITVDHTFVNGQAASAASMNSAFACITNGLYTGTSDIGVASVGASNVTVANGMSAGNVVINNTLTVTNTISGDRQYVVFRGSEYVAAGATPAYTKNVYVNGSYYFIVGVVPTMDRGSYPVSSGARISVGTSSTTYGATRFTTGPNIHGAYASGNSMTDSPGYVMPRSGSIVGSTYLTYPPSVSSAAMYKGVSVVLDIVFDE